jgi:sugar transferase (PEP-CTERM/EpsH1 system associated)
MPYPPDRGDRIRSYHMLKLLSHHFDLAIACTSEEPAWLQHHQLLATIARRVAIQPIQPSSAKYRSLLAVARHRAITPTVFFRQALAETILQWHEQEPFDTVFTFCTGMIEYARLLTHPDRKIKGPAPRHVIDLVDVDSIKWEAYANSTWSPMRCIYRRESKLLRRIEAGKEDHFDAIMAVSEAEVAAYRQHVGEHANLCAVGNGVDLNYFKPQEDSTSHDMCFVGVLDYKPNADSVCWFVHHVLPQVRKKVPDARLLIVGRNPTPRIEDLARHPGVVVIGSVPDVRTYIAQAALVIAPLQIARGVQNKVLEAMASQRLTICSPAAAEGIDAEDGRHFLVAHDPEQWAAHVERGFNDIAYRQRIAAAAREQVETAYAWSSRLEPMLKLITGK